MNKNFLQVWNILNQWSTFITLTIFLGKMDTGILGDPGADSGGEGKSKRAEK